MAKKLNQATLQYGGQNLDLAKSTTQLAVKLNPSARPSKKNAKQFADSSDLEKFKLINAPRGADAKLDKMRLLPEVSVGTHVYNLGGEEAAYIPTGNLYIEFAPGTDPEQQHAALEALHLNIKEIVAPGALRASVTADSPNPVKCAIALQKNKCVRVAEPEFVTQPLTRDFAIPAGKFAITQWHHENTGQAIPIVEIPNAVYGHDHFIKGADAKINAAWTFLQGLGNKNLRIAVIDTGFDIDHPMLKGDGTKVRNAFNAGAKTPDVSPVSRLDDGSLTVYSHGTSCAAVAAGAWDYNGLLGACPNARIIPIKLDILSDDAIRNAFEHALLNSADIISCSLGFPTPVPLSTFISNYLAKVAREGRGGRGLPIFFAAGNANPNSNNLPRPISDFAAHPDVMTVTASNSLDQSSDYTFFGRNAFLCAPTNGDPGIGISTAEVKLADDGINLDHTYTSGFGGTSSAAPLTAGICGLVLSANPNLSISQVRDVLKNSCDRIGSSSDYDANGHSDYFGYGRVNALKAVTLAAKLAAGGGGTVQPTPSPTPAPNPTPNPLPTPPPIFARQKGKIISKFLNVRTGPGTTNPKVDELKQGTVVDLFQKVDNWWRIGTKRYVSGDYIQVLPVLKTAKVINTYLNVRSGPAVNNAKVDELHFGDVVSVYETSADNWLRIGDNRWVLGKYVQLLG